MPDEAPDQWLAAIISHKISIKGKSIAVIVTGGNVDAASFCGALDAAAKLDVDGVGR
jgi:threonine dehydratase